MYIQGNLGAKARAGKAICLYNWRGQYVYKFAVMQNQDGNNHTIYTAYFFAPEVGKWQLIASFSRPKTNTYLKHLHSFLENFEPEQGTITRKVFFSNEWIADENGKWAELNKARFTIDNTGQLDTGWIMPAGTSDGAFYLKNCGFFNKL